MSTPTGSKSAAALLQNASQQGAIPTSSVAIAKAPDLGAQIQNGMGCSPDVVQSSESTVNTLILDDSSSTEEREDPNNPQCPQNYELIIEGHNLVVDALSESHDKAGILFCSEALNKGIINPFVLLQDVTRLDRRNFKPYGNTPLYDKYLVCLLRAEAKRQELADAGVSARCVTLVCTDGEDYGSQRSAKECYDLSKALAKTNMHIVLGMGIVLPGGRDFREVFKSMGLHPECILTPKNTGKEIRAAFRLFSQVSKKASSGAQGFSKVMGGGFASP